MTGSRRCNVLSIEMTGCQHSCVIRNGVYTGITERYGPAVVNISVTGASKVSNDSPLAQGEGDPLANGDIAEFLRRFQQGQRPGRGGPGAAREMPTRGQGSGFIVNADGIILTNAHVVRDAKEVTVKLTDRREFRAKVLDADAKTDVAVLKIEASRLPVANSKIFVPVNLG